MNKRYCIDIKEVPYETKKKKCHKNNDYTFLLLILAIVTGIILSPDLVDITQYLLKDKYENTNSL